MSVQELTQKLIANEDKVQAARQHYTFTQDVLVQTLEGKAVDGQFHQITNVSYDDKGKRVEKVSFAEQSTLRGIQLSDADYDDIRTFMPWILTSDQAAQYNLTYAGKQHVDDLDTYVFHVEPKQFEKNRRYFQGKIWVDDRDVQMVKLCGKSVPEATTKKKKKSDTLEVRPTFAGYRQIVDGNWFPTYARIDDTLRFGVAVDPRPRDRQIHRLPAHSRNPDCLETLADSPGAIKTDLNLFSRYGVLYRYGRRKQEQQQKYCPLDHYCRFSRTGNLSI